MPSSQKVPFAILLVVAGYFVLHKSKTEPGRDKPQVQTHLSSQEPLVDAVGRNAPTVFDVPALIGLDINGLRQKLGPPTQFVDPATMPKTATFTDWDMTWSVGKEDLLVTYDLKSGRVTDFFVSANDPSGASADLTHMRSVTNTCATPSNYQLVPVAALGASRKYTGLKIVPR